MVRKIKKIVNRKEKETENEEEKVRELKTNVARKDTSWYEDCEKNMKEVFEKEYKNYVS